MSVKTQIDSILKSNQPESTKENQLRNLLIGMSPDKHEEDDLIQFRNYYWSKQATQPHTVLILQIIADELDRRSSEKVSIENLRLSKQSNSFAYWALIIAAISLGVSLLIPLISKSCS